MLKRRIVARLDIKGGNVVKGVCMEGLRVVGKPNDLAVKYADGGADELLLLDVVASLYGRNALLPVIEAAGADVFVPITVGGGVRTIDDIRALLLAGADKVAINTAAIRRPAFIAEAAAKFGSQAIVVHIEAKARPGGWECMTECGREPTGKGAISWAAEAEALGAGEILITSVDRDGTRLGMDTALLDGIAAHIPVVAGGGAGTPEHVNRALNLADAVALGSMLHGGASIAALKADIGQHHPIRLAA